MTTTTFLKKNFGDLIFFDFEIFIYQLHDNSSMSFGNIINRNLFSRIFLAPYKGPIDTLEVEQLGA